MHLSTPIARKIAPALFFVLVLVLAFWKVMFHEEFTLLTGADMCAQSFPWFHVGASWLKRGVLLLWDPYVYAGKANLGELQTGILYPLNWLVMLTPSENEGINLAAVEGLIMIDYFMAAFFLYLLARSFSLRPAGAALAGVAFAFGGFNTFAYGYLNIWGSFVWIPLILLCFRKALLAGSGKSSVRWTVACGLALSLSFLAGHHLPPVHASLLMALYAGFVVFRGWGSFSWRERCRPAILLLSTLIILLLLTAHQWLPSAEYAQRVYRWIGSGDPVKWGEPIPYSVLQSTGNLSPQDTLSLLLPFVSTSYNMYIGAAALFLALAGFLFARPPEARLFGAAAVVYLMLSWGLHTVLHGWLNTFVPGIWFAREVYHYQVPFMLCVALLAGWGLDQLVDSYRSGREPEVGRFVRRTGWGIASVVLFCGMLMTTLALLKEMPMDHAFIHALGTLAAYLVVLGFLLFLLHTGRIRSSTFGYLMIAVVVIDLTSHMSVLIRTEDRERGEANASVQAYWRIPPAGRFLQERRGKEIFRVDDPEQIFPPNFGDSWLLEETMGHGATALVDYLAFRSVGWGPGSNATALLNASYFVSRVPVSGMPKVFEEGEAVYFNPRAVPRAFVSERYRSFRDSKEILNWIQNPLFSPRETVLLLGRDLETVDPSFLRSAREERDGVRLVGFSRRTAAEKEAERTADSEARHRLIVFQAPWGWSPGDEVEIQFEPERRGQDCYLVLSYYPDPFLPSRLTLKLEGPDGSRELRVELPAGEADSPLRRAHVSLGALEATVYRAFLATTEECRARIDSVRIAGEEPIVGAEAGSLSIRSFGPMRVVLDAELSRPSFVVVSQIHYPGWEARVDGSRVPLLAGDYALQTVPVPSGRHEIQLRFRPKTFYAGLVVCLLSLAGLGFLWIVTRAREP